MAFTREEINEIVDKLKLLSKKDSSFTLTESLNTQDEIAILQNGKNKKVSIDTFLEYLADKVVASSKFYNVTVNCAPSNAKVTMNGIEGSVQSFKENSSVNIVCSLDGYTKVTRNIPALTEDTVINNVVLTPIKETCKVKVNVKVNDSIADLLVNFDVYINGIKGDTSVVEKGSRILVKVTDGNRFYKDFIEYYTINSDTTITVTPTPIPQEEKTYVQIILGNPSDPSYPKIFTIFVESSGLGIPTEFRITRQAGFYLTKGSDLHYIITAPNYKTINKRIDDVDSLKDKSGTVTIYENPTLLATHTLKVYPTPIDAIDINIIINDSHYVLNSNSGTDFVSYEFNDNNRSIYYKVSKEGYNSEEGQMILPTDHNLYVKLKEKQQSYGTLNFNITPPDATVKVNGVIVEDISVPYTVPANTELTIEVSKEGYVTKTKSSIYVSAGETYNIEVTLNQEEAEPVGELEIIEWVSTAFDKDNLTSQSYNLGLQLNYNDVNVSSSVTNSVNASWFTLTYNSSDNIFDLVIPINNTTEKRYGNIIFNYTLEDGRVASSTYTFAQNGINLITDKNTITLPFNNSSSVLNVTSSSDFFTEITY